MSDRRRLEKLEELLGVTRGAPGLAELEDRVLDSGHLEEEDYGVVLERRESAEGFDNLRRHLLFCPVCSRELLSRVAPEAEREFEAAARRRFRLRLLLAAGAVFLAGVGALAALLNDDAGAGGSTPPPAPGFEEAWAGLGAAAPVAGLEPGRLHLHLPADLPEPQHLYVFVVKRDGVEPLHPGTGSAKREPATGGWVPPGGWEDPGPGSRLLVLASTAPLPVLATEGDRRSWARNILQQLLSGRGLDAVAGTLQRELLGGRGRVLVLTVAR